MLFLVRTLFTKPEDLDETSIAELLREEAVAASSLQERGVILELWRDLSDGAAWGVWDVPDGKELEDYQSELPCFTYMHSTAYPIAIHPNRLAVIRDNMENA